MILLAIGFSQCASVKFDQKPPFTVTNATYTSWVGGIKGASGTNVKFYYKTNANVVFEDIYYKGRLTKAELKKDKKGTLVVGYFKNESTALRDLQLHSDPKQEYGNQPPKKIEDFPFELKDNEAVISFTEDGKTKYYKVANIKREKSPLIP